MKWNFVLYRKTTLHVGTKYVYVHCNYQRIIKRDSRSCWLDLSPSEVECKVWNIGKLENQQENGFVSFACGIRIILRSCKIQFYKSYTERRYVWDVRYSKHKYLRWPYTFGAALFTLFTASLPRKKKTSEKIAQHLANRQTLSTDFIKNCVL